jgi:hypothetical protein
MKPLDQEKLHQLLRMGAFSETVGQVYAQVIDHYHVYDSIDQPIDNPYEAADVASLFYAKGWIDVVQWHLEDEIRNPAIEPVYALVLKRRIDALNQERTNRVELIDDCLLAAIADVPVFPNARVNSESPAWALDRLSILALKIYHMRVEADRTGVLPGHVQQCRRKLAVLYEQQKDLSLSINELLLDISKGHKCMKVYKQMKMYNNPQLNPVLYKAARP